MAKKTTKATKATKNVTTAASANGFATTVSTAMAQLSSARTTLASLGLAALTPAQRQDTNGKLRVGEAQAMTTVLDAMDAYPQLVSSLADVDTATARADLALWSALTPVLAEIDAIQTEVSDALIESASAAKDVTVPAYAILRANAPANAALAKKLAPALTFYGHPAKQRAANIAKAARKTAKAKGTTAVAKSLSN
jgi:hypothetical protein